MSRALQFGMQLLTFLGLPQLLLWLGPPGVRVLMYHGVCEQWPPQAPFRGRGKHVPANLFRRQMAWVKRWMRPLSVQDLVELLAAGTPLPRRGVVITLDDGYRNNLLHAAPILAALGIPATVYVTSSLVEERCMWVDRVDAAMEASPAGSLSLPGEEGGDGPVWQGDDQARAVAGRLRRLGKNLAGPARERLVEAILAGTDHDLERLPVAKRPADVRGLQPEDLTRLQEAGVAVGAHTMTHQILSRCDDKLLQRELCGARVLLEDWSGRTVQDFAYPNGAEGDFDQRTRAGLQSAGYRSGMTTVRGVVRQGDDVLTLRRVPINGDESFSAFLADVSGLRDLLLRLRGFIRRLAGRPDGGGRRH